MRCPRCGSENVSYQVDSKVKHSFWWGFKGQTTTYAVCQNCGKRWKRNPFEKPTNSNAQTGYSSAQTVYGYNQGYVYGTNTFCQSCGTQLNGGNFCPNCGQPVTQPLIPPNPIQVPQMNINLHRADQQLADTRERKCQNTLVRYTVVDDRSRRLANGAFAK